MMHLSWKRVSSIVYFLICIGGFTYQANLIIQLYLQYKVTSKIIIFFPNFIHPQDCSFCIRYSDILKFNQLNQETERNWSYSQNVSLIRKYQHELTIQEILRYTPNENEIVNQVSFKSITSKKIEASGASVRDHLFVKKYVYLEYVCYKIGLREQVSLDFDSLAVTPVGSGLVYQFQFNETVVDSSELIKIAFSDREFYPYRALRITPVVYRGFNNARKSVQYNRFTVHSYTMTIYNLPPPYETRCYDYSIHGFSNEVHCVQTCLQKHTLNHFDKLPFSSIISVPSNKRIISYIDMENDSFISRLEELRSLCKENCSYIGCVDGVIVTTTDAKLNNYFMLKYVVPQQPSIRIMLHAEMKMIEFFTYLFSIVSTWTGLSVLSLDPVKLWQAMQTLKKDRRLVQARMRLANRRQRTIAVKDQ